MAGGVPDYGTTCRQDDHVMVPDQAGGGAVHGGQVTVGLGEGRPGLIFLVPPAPPRQGPVSYDADAAERAVQHAGLHWVRVCPALVRRPHDKKPYSTKSGSVNVTRREGERRFLPGLKTGVSTPQKR
jgi:hypothetical protein